MMKLFICSMLVFASIYTTTAIAHESFSSRAVVEFEMRNFLSNLNNAGISAGKVCLSAKDHNPDDCCTVFEPGEEPYMECPCGSGTCDNEFMVTELPKVIEAP